MLFLAVLGGAAVLEVHRALQPSAREARRLKQTEQELIKQLKDAQSALQDVRRQKDEVDAELSGLTARTVSLEANCSHLQSANDELHSTNEELRERAERLLERQAHLEQTAASLKLENGTLLEQFDRLKLAYQEESAAFKDELASLKERVVEAFAQFTAGDISAEQLVAYLSQNGVALKAVDGPDGAASPAGALTARLDSARTREERQRSLEHVELAVEQGWAHQVRLISCDVDRARRLMTGAALTARPHARALPEAVIPARDDAGSFLEARLPSALQRPAPLRLATAHNNVAAESAESRIPKAPPAREEPNSEALKENAVQEPPVKKAAPKKSRGITFLPKKKQAPPAQGAGGRGPVPALALGRIGVDEDIDAGSGVAGRSLIGF